MLGDHWRSRKTLKQPFPHATMYVDKILFLIVILDAPVFVPLFIGTWLEGKRRFLDWKSMLLCAGIGYSAEGTVIGLLGWPMLAIVSAIIFCGLTLTLALAGKTERDRISSRRP